MDFKEIKRLHALGFAIHWLKQRSKVPAKAGWTSGPRSSLVELKNSYIKGYNVGVRLGSVSKIGKHFLAVIDLDIKSSESRHRLEAEKKLFELFPEAKTSPLVFSGRGNGSAHYYILTKEPLSGENRKGMSSDIVKVEMPSAEKPSKREIERLSKEELEKGIRLRPAWEISLMSEGRQVVLPGSVHPDTGAFYSWARKVAEDGSNMPVISTQATISTALSSADAPISEKDLPIKFVPVDVDKLGLREDQLEALKTGEGVEDRSAYCFSLCMALLQRKVEEDKIISILTNKDFFLGQVGFDHAKTTSRVRAAIWVKKYCLAKALEKVNANLFVHEIVEEGQPVPDWMQSLDQTTGKGITPKLKATFKNALTILENDVSPALVKRNLFSNEDFFGVDTPWGFKAGQKRSGGIEDALFVKNWLIHRWGFEAPVNLIEEVLLHIASQNEFHPVREFLEALEWDGVSRIDTAFKTYLNAKMPEPYLTDVTRKFFIALVKRIYEPGAKFDHIPVFEGKQGIGKSSFGKLLVGKEWFMDGLPDLADKDAALNLQGIWLVEMSELSALYRSQLETAKAFISRETDKVRPPYGRRRIDLPRQCCFLGTTNSEDYLSDPTGNRRYWPVRVEQVDFAALERDRLQLLAEAKFLFDFANEPLWLRGKSKKQAEAIQELRRLEDESDAMATKFLEFLNKPEKDRQLKDISSLSIDDLFNIEPFGHFRQEFKNTKHAALVLRKAGYIRVHTKQGKRWVTAKKKTGGGRLVAPLSK